MNIQIIMLLFAVLALICFLGMAYGIQVLVKQGRDPGKQLVLADAIVDTVVSAHTALETFIPAPVESIIDMVLKVTQAGVHSAQQLYNSGQLPPDLRKEQATEYAVNMIKLTGREVTPELEHVIRGTAEAAVYVMKQKEVVTVPVVDPDPALVVATVDPAPTPDITITPPDTAPAQPPADEAQSVSVPPVA